ncbi:hypothetical protein VB834_29340 [Limnoraphis robusta Tam1]|nr:hypothetical protein [Limnoraphis robusta]MEA5543139.1 hypothetical protein [Limnoraphis robusta Tam1]
MTTNYNANNRTLNDYLSFKYPMSIYPENEGGYTILFLIYPDV